MFANKQDQMVERSTEGRKRKLEGEQRGRLRDNSLGSIITVSAEQLEKSALELSKLVNSLLERKNIEFESANGES